MKYLVALTVTTIFGNTLMAQEDEEYKDAEEDYFPEEYLYTEVDYADHKPFEQLTILPKHQQSFPHSYKKETQRNNSKPYSFWKPRPSTKCPYSWKMIQDSCFKHFKEMSSWVEAQEKCQSSSKA